MTVRITVKDLGAEKLLRNLLSKGALSVGILEADAATPHKEGLTALDRQRLAHAQRLAKGGFRSSKAEIARLRAKKKNTEGQLTIGEIAAIHEFGLGSVPERSFLRGWVDESRDLIDSVLLKGAQALVRGKLSDPIQFLNQFGAWAVGQIQRRMSQNIPPPLAPTTIKRKGSSVALIDTGQLRSSISFRVDAVQLGKGSTFITKIGAGQ